MADASIDGGDVDSIQWSPNPYALAQALLGDVTDDEKLLFDGTEADSLLKRALLRPDAPNMLASFRNFQVIAAKAGSESTTPAFASAMSDDLVQKAVHIYGKEAVERALPSLVPLSDPALNQLTLGDAVTSLNNRVERLANANQLLITDASYLDPMQGDVGDCYLIAAIIALAWCKPTLLSARLADAGFTPPEQASFAWQFHDNEGQLRGRRSVSGRIPVRGSIPRYAHSATSGEHWPGLIEKAFVMHMRSPTSSGDEPTRRDYLRIEEASNPPRVCRNLVGGKVRGRQMEDPFDPLKVAGLFVDHNQPALPLHSEAGVMTKPVMAWTKKKLDSTDPDTWTKTGLWPNHAYAVLGLMMETKHVVLRNPHGFATEERPGYAKGPWKPGDQSIDLNTKGVFALSPDVFAANFANIGWVEGL